MTTKPEIDTSDFYAFEHLLADDERAVLHAVRDFMTAEVDPIVNAHWERGPSPSRSFRGSAASASPGSRTGVSAAQVGVTCSTG